MASKEPLVAGAAQDLLPAVAYVANPTQFIAYSPAPPLASLQFRAPICADPRIEPEPAGPENASDELASASDELVLLVKDDPDTSPLAPLTICAICLDNNLGAVAEPGQLSFEGCSHRVCVECSTGLLGHAISTAQVAGATQCPYFTSGCRCEATASDYTVNDVLTAPKASELLVSFGGSHTLVKKFKKFSRSARLAADPSALACTSVNCEGFVEMNGRVALVGAVVPAASVAVVLGATVGVFLNYATRIEEGPLPGLSEDSYQVPGWGWASWMGLSVAAGAYLVVRSAQLGVSAGLLLSAVTASGLAAALTAYSSLDSAMALGLSFALGSCLFALAVLMVIFRRAACGDCGNSMCTQCHSEWHVLQGCADRHGTDSNLSEANTRPCPVCRIPTAKDGACMHMSCSVCSSEYCWVCRSPFPCGSVHFEMTDSNRTHPLLFRIYERGSILSQIVMNFIATTVALVAVCLALVLWPLTMMGGSLLVAAIFKCFDKTRNFDFKDALYGLALAWAIAVLGPIALAVALALFYIATIIVAAPTLVIWVLDMARLMCGRGSLLLGTTLEKRCRGPLDAMLCNGTVQSGWDDPPAVVCVAAYGAKVGLAMLWMSIFFWPAFGLSLALFPVTSCLLCPSLCLPRLGRGPALMAGMIAGLVTFAALHESSYNAPSCLLYVLTSNAVVWACTAGVCTCVVFCLLHCPPMTNTAFFAPLWYMCAVPVGVITLGVHQWTENKGTVSNLFLPFHMLLFGRMVGLDDY